MWAAHEAAGVAGSEGWLAWRGVRRHCLRVLLLLPRGCRRLHRVRRVLGAGCRSLHVPELQRLLLMRLVPALLAGLMGPSHLLLVLRSLRGMLTERYHAVGVGATRLWVRHKVYMIVGESPHAGRQTRTRREPKARRGREQTRDRHACCFPFTGRAVNHNRPLAFSQEL